MGDLTHHAGRLRVGELFAAGTGFFDGLFDRFAGFASAFLNAAQQFLLLAFGKLEIVASEVRNRLVSNGFRADFLSRPNRRTWYRCRSTAVVPSVAFLAECTAT